MNGACDGAYITEECDYVQTGQNRTFFMGSEWLGERLNSILAEERTFSKDTKNHGRGEKTCVLGTGRCHRRKKATTNVPKETVYVNARMQCSILDNKAAEFRGLNQRL